MRRLARLVLYGMVLMSIAMVSAITAMRYAIHGREAQVPELVGLGPQAAEQKAADAGFSLVIENKYYSVEVPEGALLSQFPAPGARVRRGWRIRATQSLGQPRFEVPDVGAQSLRAAEFNLQRRGLEVASIAITSLSGGMEGQVLGQSPTAKAAGLAEPRVSLLASGPDLAAEYVMPDLTGQPLSSVAKQLEKTGFRLILAGVQNPDEAERLSTPPPAKLQVLVLGQSPAPGQKVRQGDAITLLPAR